MLPRIAYVTHAATAAGDPDLSLALAAFAKAGLDGVPHAWDAVVDWADFDLVLVRSAWDYYDRRQEFLRWARAVEEETTLANPALTLARNTDRTYLRDLARSGIATVDTVWFEPGDSVADCRDALTGHDWRRFVVKPNIGGGDVDTRLTRDVTEATEFAEALAANGRVAMIQPYLPEVERAGEVSVVLLGGVISHAVTRIPPFTADGVPRAGEAVEIPGELVDFVEHVVSVAAYGEDLLYARVDLVGHEGRWLLMEFEATHPQLFLGSDQKAPDRLAHAVRQALMPDSRQWDSASG